MSQSNAMPTASAAERPGAMREFPCSSVQTRLWALQQLVPDDPVYNVSLALRLSAALPMSTIERAVAALFREHGVFRTTFPSRHGIVKQAVHDEWPAPVECWHEQVEASSRAHRAEEIVRGATAAAFDLGRAPAIRAGIVEFAPDDHLVYLILHHLIIDQSSIQILIADFESLLRGDWSGSAQAPSEPYSSFATWEAGYLGSDRFRRDLDKWRKALAGAPVHVDLQTDRPRGKQPTLNGDIVRVIVPDSLFVVLRERAVSWRVTPNMYFLAAWVLHLYRRHRQTDIILGSGIANRPSEMYNRTVGCFTNTLPLRVKVNPDWSFRRLLDEVRRTCIGAFEHRFVPYAELVKLSSQASLVGPTYGNVYYDYHSEGMSTLDRMPHVQSAPVQVFNRRAKCDLTFNVTATPSRLNALVEFNSDLFMRESVQRMAEDLQDILRRSVDDPDEKVAAARPSSGPPRAAERLGEPEGLESLHGRFSARAQEVPDRLAVQEGSRQLSYGELDRLSDRLAFALIERGIRSEALVGLGIPRSIESVIAVIGIWKAGAAYVPLDPAYGDARLSQMLEDAHPALVIGTAATLAGCRWAGPSITVGELLEQPLARAHRLPEVSASDLAYVIYTSGSTGTPKGIMVPNRVPWCRVNREFLPISESDVFCHRTSLNFVDSIWEIFAPLIRGARLIVISPDLSRDPQGLVTALAVAEVTCVVVVPALVDLLLESIDGLQARLPKLRLWVCGGDELTGRLAEKFAHRLPAATLVNSYGTSETWDIAWHSLQPSGEERVPVGRQVPGVYTYVLDGQLRPVPVGTEGDLYVGGEMLSRGYLGRPDLTAESFMPDPFGEGARIYRTGDRARVGADELLYLTGRQNRQVKINAYRIELAEVEGALLSHPSVRAAVAVAVEASVGKALVAFVVARESTPSLPAALERHLADRLPSYALPGTISILESLPMMPNGKIDRRALAGQATKGAPVDSGEQPGTVMEKRIIAAVEKVLRTRGVEAGSNFFALGGNSISAILLISALRKEGIEVSLPDILLRKTIRDIAKVARSDSESGRKKERQPYGGLSADSRACIPAGAVDAFPATAMQQALISETLAWPERLLNVFVVRAEVQGRLDRPRLAQALRRVIELHPALRSSFIFDTSGRLLQVVFGTETQSPELDLGASVRLDEYVTQLGESLSKGHPAPLLRTMLAEGPGSRCEVTLIAHHAIFDAWSVGIFFRDLLHAYQSDLPRDGRGDLAALAGFADENLKASSAASVSRFWAKTLGDWKTSSLLQAAKLPLGEGGRDVFEMPVPADTLRHLARIADAQQVPLRSLILATHCSSIGRWQGRQDVCTGVVVNTRGHVVDAKDLIGLFVNVVPLRVRLSQDWVTLARQTLRFETTAAPFTLCPTSVIKAAVGTSCGLETVFNYVNVAEVIPDSLLGTVNLVERRSSVRSSIPLLTTFAVTREGSGVITLESRDGTWSHAELECLGRLYRDNIDALVEGAGLGSVAGALRTPAEVWSAHDFDATATLHQLFRRQVSRTPAAVAVRDAHQALAYRELNQLSEQLAQSLRAQGVRPGVLVGLALPRSSEMFVALLAILKAGGAYLPLDTDQGSIRLKTIVETAGPRVILADCEHEAFRGHRVLLLRDASRWEVPAIPSEVAAEPAADDLAYVIFTSGSTGQPKGVMTSHRSIVNRLQWMAAEMGISASDVFLQKTPLTFDVSVWECFLPLLCGAEVVCAKPRLQYDPDYLVQALSEHRVTIVHFVPQFLNELVQHPAAASALASVRRIVCSGDVLHPDIVGGTQQVAPSVAIYNLYGPTEAAVDVTSHLITTPEADPRWVPIGRPIWNTAVYVLDEQLQPLPAGVVGELFLAGVGLARGYVGSPELTAERFLPDPHGPPGSRMYRTGDYGRRLPDGNIHFLGRIDGEVKVSGVRINVAEVEAALASFRPVRAATVRLEHGRLIAYLVLRPDVSFNRAALYEHVSAYLGKAALPARYGVLDALPVTSSGKVDRRADRAYSAARWINDGAAVDGLARTETEAVFLEVWQRILRQPELRPGDDFHAAGGDSISAVRIVHGLRKLGFTLGVEELFKHSTVAGLARLADASQQGEAPLPAIELPTPPDASGAVTDIQRHVLERYLDDHDGASGVFHLQFAYRFQSEAFSLEAFRRALTATVARHAALRSRFLRADGAWRQVVDPPVEATLSLVDLRSPSGRTDDRGIREYLRNDRRARFDGATGPLVRFALATIDDAQGWFVMVVHHAVYDGWSHQRFLAELLRAYAAEKRGQAPPSIQSEAVFAELPAIERIVGAHPEAREFFAAQCPGLRAEGSNRSLPHAPSRFQDLAAELDGGLLFDLVERGRRARVSLKAVLVNAFSMAVLRTASRRTIGLITSGRSPLLSEPFQSVGLFWNVLPMARASGDRSDAGLRNTQHLLNRLDHLANFPFLSIEGWRANAEYIFRFLNFPALEEPSDVGHLAIKDAVVMDRYDFPFVLTTALSNGTSTGALFAQFDGARISEEVAEAVFNAFLAELRAHGARGSHQEARMSLGAGT